MISGRSSFKNENTSSAPDSPAYLQFLQRPALPFPPSLRKRGQIYASKAAGSVQQVKVAEIRKLWDPVADQRVPRFHLGPVERFAVIGDKRLNIDFTQKAVIEGGFVPRLWQQMLFDDYAVVIHPCMAEQKIALPAPPPRPVVSVSKKKSWLGVYPLLESEWETALLFHRLTVSCSSEKA